MSSLCFSQHYPKKIWTKIESDQFKERFRTGEVVPVWFSDTTPSMFDESRKVGGLTFDISLPLKEETERIAKVLLRKLAESQQPAVVRFPERCSSEKYRATLAADEYWEPTI